MAGIKYLTDIEVTGSAMLGTVPNNTGTLLVLSGVDGKTISTRTNAQIIVDMGLVTTGQVSSTLIANWNTAYTNNHTHANKAFLDTVVANATLGINISGSAAKWNGYEFVATDAPIHSYMMAWGTDSKFHYTSAANVKTWLGLGSAAYQNTSVFFETAATMLGTASMDTALTTGVYRNENGAGGVGAYRPVLVLRSSDTGMQISGGHNSDALQFRGFSTGGATFTAWRSVWHNGNFTPANYLPLAGGTMTGTTTFSGTARIETWAAEAMRLYGNDSYISGWNTSPVIRNGFIQFGNGILRLQSETGTKYITLNPGGGNVGIGFAADIGVRLAVNGASIFDGIMQLRTGSYLRIWNADNSYGSHTDTRTDINHQYIVRGSDNAALVWKENWWDGTKYHSAWASTTGFQFGSAVSALRLCAGHDPGIANSVSASGWFRSSGASGWFSTDFGGGIHMTETTSVRVYGSKQFVVENSISITAGYFVSGSAAGGFKSNNFRGMVGDYELNTTAEKIIWTIGHNWNTLATHYGLGYAYSTKYLSAGHQITFKEAGILKAAIHLGSGNAWFDGQITGSTISATTNLIIPKTAPVSPVAGQHYLYSS